LGISVVGYELSVLGLANLVKMLLRNGIEGAVLCENVNGNGMPCENVIASLPAGRQAERSNL